MHTLLQGIIPTQGSLSPALSGRFFTTSATWEAQCTNKISQRDQSPQDLSPREGLVLCYVGLLLLWKEWPPTQQLKQRCLWLSLLLGGGLQGSADCSANLWSHKPTVKALAGLDAYLEPLGQTLLLNAPGFGGVHFLLAIALGLVSCLALGQGLGLLLETTCISSYAAASVDKAGDGILSPSPASDLSPSPPASSRRRHPDLKGLLDWTCPPWSSPSHTHSSAQRRV